MPPAVTLTSRGVERFRRGHPWIYRSDLAAVQAAAGDVVRVLEPRGHPIAHALYSDRSQIAIRVITRNADAVPADFWHERIASAIGFRESLRLPATAYRLVHGEADRLPSLIVDRYADCLVVQTLSQGTDRALPAIVGALTTLLSPRGILARNDSRVRVLEGLEQKTQLLHGSVPETVDIEENGVRFVADLWRGQKTGLFLDQRENRAAAARYARGRLLDCFSYSGGFALTLAPRCTDVIALDIADDAANRIRVNAALNGVRLDVRSVNVFDELRELDRAGERFDTIVLDPPAFAKNRGAVAKALAGYKEINLRALKLLKPGGYLVTCSCSHHVDEGTFGQVVHAAAIDAGAAVVVVEKRMQGRDHPVLLGVPETHYLKCLVLRKLPET
jgi:23S rRNA (cytosine1962-C5)-methyltransferase